MHKETYILHLDGDSFFAQCEVAQFPHLRGKPVVVGQERGIAVAMSHEAKKVGVTRGMPIFKIKKFYPEVIILPSHFELYQKYCDKMAAAVRKYIDSVEVYSIDECFALIEGGSWEEATELVKKIKVAVQAELGITFSFGLARTKVLAKVASRSQKPNGLTLLSEKLEDKYLAETPIEKIWGIGYRTAPKLKARGITTALQFRDLPETFVKRTFAKPLEEIWYELSGLQIMAVGNSHEDPKSLQATRTFTPATHERDLVFSELSKNIEIACIRMRRYELLTNYISFFLKTSEFKYRGLELKLPFYTNNPSDILDRVLPAFDYVFARGVRYRATGITLMGLRTKDKCQEDLFGLQKGIFEEGRVQESIDRMRAVYGTNAVFLASSLPAILRRATTKRADFARVKSAPVPSYLWNLPFPFLGEVV